MALRALTLTAQFIAGVAFMALVCSPLMGV